MSFRIFKKSDIEISVCGNDAESGVKEIVYFKSSYTTGLSNIEETTKLFGELEKLYASEDTPFVPYTDTFKVETNEKAVIYVRVMDKAGNVTYISSDGMIVDSVVPKVVEITTNADADKKIQNRSVTFEIEVKDSFAEDEAFSGIKKVYYVVSRNGQQIGEEHNLYEWNEREGSLRGSWTGSFTLDSCESREYNQDNLKIEMIAEDNAQNGSSERIAIKIDITPPSIQVAYTNNTSNGTLFKESRTARIYINERNFGESYVNLLVNGQAYRPVNGWLSSGGTGNGDNTVWSADVPFIADDDYTFNIECTDLAANKSGEVDYGNSTYPTSFTIDGTKPNISVEFIEDENPHVDNYYQNPRTAQITIDELHFDKSAATEGVKCSVSIDEHDNIDESKTSTIILSDWTQVPNSNRYVATMQMEEDAKYSLNVQYTDMAGNVGESYQTEFYVDNVDPALAVSVNDSKKRGAYSGEVKSVISYDDTNFDEKQVEISLSGVNVDVSDCKVNGENLIFTLKNQSGNMIEWNGKFADIMGNGSKVYGKTLSFENFPEGEDLKEFDDIYTLTVSLTDKSGRTSSENLTFSVNRFGSTYDITQIKDILGTYSQRSPEIVVSEINPDELMEYSITLFKNNETIVLNKGSDYNVDVIGDKNEWHEYIYTIPASNFTDDGVYSITLHSVDEAKNVSENTLDTKDSEISFAVDNTPPKVIVANLESGETYAEDTKQVVMTADDNLLLSNIAVYLDNSSTVLAEWNYNKITQILENENVDGKEFSFEISGDSTRAHTLKVVCTDAAGNMTELEFDGFYVTTNMWIRYINNKPLLFCSIAGILVLTGGVIFIVIKRKKRS